MGTIEDRLSQALREVLGRGEARQACPPRGSAGAAPGPEADAISEATTRWEIPKDPAFGDLSNAASFKLAARREQSPHQIADELAGTFLSCCREAGLDEWIERVEAKGGFLNIFLSQQALIQVLWDILRQGRRYGRRMVAHRPSINIEFVSANPTGPLSVAHGRQAAVGDVLARLLRSHGYQVTTEYYLNDEGRQIELLGRSLRARYAELLGRPEPFPEDGYQGAYLYDLAKESIQRYGTRLLHEAESSTLPTFSRIGMARMLKEIRQDLTRFGLVFDRWTSQRWLRTSGRIGAALKALEAKGALYESDEATWFASTQFGDDKDRVVRKRDGELTYLAPDIAYHRWKFQRGYEQVLNLWGPDHHGYIARVKAALAALGLSADRLAVRVVQLVTLSRKGKPIPMSKRQGEFVTFREILDEVGVDATRFFFLMRTMESHLDFDLDLAKSQSQENPVYYVQYAHARICSILSKARLPWWLRLWPDLRLLQELEERLLLRRLFQYPIVLRLCAAALEPHGLTVYLRKLAESFHVFYTRHRVISDDPQRSAARVALIRATQHVFANGLGILGVSAPRRM
jgi:arginyl-tRNA synthetase